jgi:uncharacterized protein (TIGR03000 family)
MTAWIPTVVACAMTSPPAAEVVGCDAAPAAVPPAGGYTRRHRHTQDYPPPPPDWTYPFLPPGPYLTRDYPFVGFPGYRGARGNLFPHPHRPVVPVYGPLPAVAVNPDPPPHPRRRALGFGVGYYGWVGPYRASPRPRPASVSVWSPYDPRGWPAPKRHGKHHAEAVAAAPMEVAPVGGCLRVAVAVPHPAAELYVDGVKTAQAGTARVFESPGLAAGAEYRYELVARWTEGGEPVVRKRVVSGRPGEVVRVDFAGPGVVPAGR